MLHTVLHIEGKKKQYWGDSETGNLITMKATHKRTFKVVNVGQHIEFEIIYSFG